VLEIELLMSVLVVFRFEIQYKADYLPFLEVFEIVQISTLHLCKTILKIILCFQTV